jgi:hypothetical protein
VKNLIRQYVGIAKAFSKEAAKALAKDRAPTFQGTLHFHEYLKLRSISRAYMHAARLLKEEMQKQSEARQRGKKLALFRRAA